MEQIERRAAHGLSTAEFYEKYMLANKPVIITGAMGSWRAMQDWVTSAGTPDARVNTSFLAERFGSAVVTAHNCNRMVMGRLRTKDMTVAEYMAWWEQDRPAVAPAVDPASADAAPVTAAAAAAADGPGPAAAGGNASGKAKKGGKAAAGPDQYYLKDWNFCKEFPEYPAYDRPEYFSQDWLNDHEAAHREDHRFVYLGPKGSFTPLHKDVLQSFSWSANVCGSKEWLFLAPENEPSLYNHNYEPGEEQPQEADPFGEGPGDEGAGGEQGTLPVWRRFPARKHIFDLNQVES
jgi:hypothetical protein